MWLNFSHFRDIKSGANRVQSEEKNDNKIQVSKLYFIFVL
jgi:hypothetical protein